MKINKLSVFIIQEIIVYGTKIILEDSFNANKIYPEDIYLKYIDIIDKYFNKGINFVKQILLIKFFLFYFN